MSERISHMESCLQCGTTTSSAVESNPAFERFADRFIGLAVRAGDVAALKELAESQIVSIGGFGHQSGASPSGPSSLYKLRQIRIARKALEAAEAMLAEQADDIHRFDSNGHMV